MLEVNFVNAFWVQFSLIIRCLTALADDVQKLVCCKRFPVSEIALNFSNFVNVLEEVVPAAVSLKTLVCNRFTLFPRVS